MADLTPRQIEQIEETHRNVLEIATALFGVKDTKDTGLCGEVKSLKKDYYIFKTRALIVVGILVGTGTLGISIYGLLGG